MNNLTPIKITYIFNYGYVTQQRTFITKEYWNSLKVQTIPLDSEIKALQLTINDKTDKEVVSQVKKAVDKLESQIKKIIPAYTFIVEHSMIGSAIGFINEGEEAETIIPYNDRPVCKVKYTLIN